MNSDQEQNLQENTQEDNQSQQSNNQGMENSNNSNNQPTITNNQDPINQYDADIKLDYGDSNNEENLNQENDQQQETLQQQQQQYQEEENLLQQQYEQVQNENQNLILQQQQLEQQHAQLQQIQQQHLQQQQQLQQQQLQLQQYQQQQEQQLLLQQQEQLLLQQQQQQQQQLLQNQQNQQNDLEGYEQMQNLVNGLNNEIFLHEGNLNGIISLLMLDQNTIFDTLDMFQPKYDLKKKLEFILSAKTKFFQANVCTVLDMYEQNIQFGHLGNLEKIMTILKSKNKEIHIKKIAHCKCNQNNNQQQEKSNNKNLENQEEQKQDNEETEIQEKKEENKENNEQQQEENNNNNDNEEQNHEHNHNHENQDQDQEPAQIQISDVFNILNMRFLDMKQFHQFNQSDQSISFKLSNSFMVYVKSSDQIVYDNTSLISNIPHSIIQNNIFPYLTAFDLFKLRGISKEWGELVRGTWHKTFKREMYEQLMAADLCKEIEREFKLVHLRNPFRQKLQLLLKAMTELINYEDISKQIVEDKFSNRDKSIIISIFKMLGFMNHNRIENILAQNYQPPQEEQQQININIENNQENIQNQDTNLENQNIQNNENTESQNQQLDQNNIIENQEQQQQQQQQVNDDDLNLQEMTNHYWPIFRNEAIHNLKSHLNKIFDQEFHFTNTQNLFDLRTKYLSSADFSIENFQGQDDKNQLLLVLFSKQCFVYALLKNYIYIIQQYIQLAKDKLDLVSKEWPENKGFLEGAYKILLLRNVKVKNGKIIQEEDEEQKQENDQNDDDEQTDTQQIMKNLLNLKNSTDLNEPDFVIKKKGTQTKVFLDNQVKIDLIYSSLLQIQQNSLSQLVTIVNETCQSAKKEEEELDKEILYCLKQFSLPQQIQKEEENLGLKLLIGKNKKIDLNTQQSQEQLISQKQKLKDIIKVQQNMMQLTNPNNLRNIDNQEEEDEQEEKKEENINSILNDCNINQKDQLQVENKQDEINQQIQQQNQENEIQEKKEIQIESITQNQDTNIQENQLIFGQDIVIQKQKPQKKCIIF